MLFPTTTFAVFFLAVLAGQIVVASRPVARKVGLIFASGVFYWWLDGRFVLLLAAVILATDLFASALVRWPEHGRSIVAVGVGVDLIVLGFFKYYEFFRTGVVDALEPLGLDPSPPLLDILLPVGVSFYLFEAIAYLVEVRRGVHGTEGSVGRLSLLDLAACLTFFPKLLSGPITRPSELASQLDRRVDRVETSAGLWLIARGLLKKMVIASYIGDTLVDGVFATPSQYSSPEVAVAIYGYAAQLYLDFSAYTDMAIGIALLLGVRLPENFRAPYTATSVQQFWTRWHMTLGRWFRDFVFQPLALAGSRSPLATAGITMAVMLLTGLWHGAGWTFVVWGGLHGLAMVVGRLRVERRRRLDLPRPRRTPARVAAQRLWTFHFIAATWVVFRADSLGSARDVLARLADPGPVDSVSLLLVAAIACGLAAQFLPSDWTARFRATFDQMGRLPKVASLGVVILLADALGPDGVAPFIYFGF